MQVSAAPGRGQRLFDHTLRILGALGLEIRVCQQDLRFRVRMRNAVAVRRERLELAVTPGPYHMVGTAAVEAAYVLGVALRDRGGGVGGVTRHGVGWQRMCEG